MRWVRYIASCSDVYCSCSITRTVSLCTRFYCCWSLPPTEEKSKCILFAVWGAKESKGNDGMWGWELAYTYKGREGVMHFHVFLRRNYFEYDRLLSLDRRALSTRWYSSFVHRPTRVTYSLPSSIYRILCVILHRQVFACCLCRHTQITRMLAPVFSGWEYVFFTFFQISQRRFERFFSTDMSKNHKKSLAKV